MFITVNLVIRVIMVIIVISILNCQSHFSKVLVITRVTSVQIVSQSEITSRAFCDAN